MAAAQGCVSPSACMGALLQRVESASLRLPAFQCGRSVFGARSGRTVVTASVRSPVVAALSIDKSDAGVVLVDHYKRLGVPSNADNAMIVKAFEARCRELTEGGAVDEEVARQKLQDLETSLEVLTSEEARRLYDWGIQRSGRGDADEYVWPFETDLTQKTYTPGVGNPPRPMVAEDDEGIAKIGYGFLAWLAVSAVLSCTLK